MANASRTLTLKLLADITNFNDGLDKGSKATKSVSDQVTDFGKKAALAFAAAGAAVGAFALSAVKAAAEDEAAQKSLEATIKATTAATDAQVAGVEKYITKTSIAIGVTDDELRPAFARLVRSVKDTEQATNLLNLALDISAATGKPLETIANALGKAYDGQTTALGRLGLGIDAATLKSKDFNLITTQLNKTYGEFAEKRALTAQVAMQRVTIAMSEAKETIGAALLPAVQDLTAWITDHFVPALQATIGGLTGDKSLKKSLGDTYQEFYKWGERIRGVIQTVINLKEEIIIVAGVMATMFVASKIAAGIAATITTINLLIKAYNALKASAFVAGVAAAFALNPLLGVAAGVAGTAAIIAATKFINGIGGGEEVSTTGIYTSNPNLIVGGSSGKVSSIPTVTGSGVSTGGGVKVSAPTVSNLSIPNTLDLSFPVGAKTTMFATGERDAATTYNINVSGAIDPEGTARTIVNTLNSSFYRGTGGAEGLVYVT